MSVTAKIQKIMIPTYEIGEAEKVPMFTDKRVYQGSTGKVYPYPTIDKISDVKVDKEYEAVYLENEYLQVMILPELGGRIQRAYDKTNDYDFVYYNQVIKPALAGLTGPWISGGIEFNWPQHHRPTTYLPVDYMIEESEDGSKSVLLHDVDQMYGTKGIAKITLYPKKAYIEIEGQLYNPTAMPQTFLWWANPAVSVNEHTQSIFPPDVHAVMDHGKRDVSKFPIATGIYYKQDYSEGVDISRYKNIPVPTSYMAEKSKYDFVGGYDHEKEAGILHVADHHISPGKKQWTWGCGDFGKAWDKNLTDEDGPYIELMTGVYTDNQPDFTWLKPFEEKTFKQYFMPYKAVGQVKNATKEAAVNLQYHEGEINVIVYATGTYEQAAIILQYDGKEIFKEVAMLSPVSIYKTVVKKEVVKEEDIKVSVYVDGKCLVEYQAEAVKIEKVPEPAKAAKDPKEIMTNEELYLTGQHIEQYRHATYQPDDYYLEGLKRDAGDIRINNAYGSLLMRRGMFEEAELYFKTALKRLIERNPNPSNSETYYLLGLTLWYQRRELEAYESFAKATWSNEQQEMSYYYLAAIDTKNKIYDKALEHIEKALVKNAHNIKARGLKGYLLRKLGCEHKALKWIEENLKLDPFDFLSGYEYILLNQGNVDIWNDFNQKMRNFQENYLMTARDYAQFGALEEAIMVLLKCTKEYPMLKYYEAYYRHSQGEKTETVIKIAESYQPDYCFPNKLEDIAVLEYAVSTGNGVMAKYYLGNLLYDKKQWQKAMKLWEESAAQKDSFPIVYRNLSLVYYNKAGDYEKARVAMEKAFSLDTKDARIFFELDQLYKKRGMSFAKRLEKYEQNRDIIEQRDDLYIEYITLVNLTGEYEKAYECMMKHKFHVWEGGEGKITAQYVLSLLEQAKQAMSQQKWQEAEELIHAAFIYPENLGEGKLEGTKDNNLYYYLGLVLEAQGRVEESKEYFEKAVLGTDEPAGVMYYNDQPADMIMYQGLAKMKLGQIKEAKARFYRLLDYGERHLEDCIKIEYFAVSLPDFVVFEEDYTKRNRVHCYYLMALGNMGLGNTKKAAEYFEKAVDIEPSHMMCQIYKTMTT